MLLRLERIDFLKFRKICPELIFRVIEKKKKKKPIFHKNHILEGIFSQKSHYFKYHIQVQGVPTCFGHLVCRIYALSLSLPCLSGFFEKFILAHNGQFLSFWDLFLCIKSCNFMSYENI